VFTHEICRRLLEYEGIESINLFTSGFEGSQEEEFFDGIRIIRRGNKYSVYSQAKQYKKNKDEFDIVIDEINTKPFNTPSFVKDKPIIALIHQLAWVLAASRAVLLASGCLLGKFL
jgi:hypothetical protein